MSNHLSFTCPLGSEHYFSKMRHTVINLKLVVFSFLLLFEVSRGLPHAKKTRRMAEGLATVPRHCLSYPLVLPLCYFTLLIERPQVGDIDQSDRISPDEWGYSLNNQVVYTKSCAVRNCNFVTGKWVGDHPDIYDKRNVVVIRNFYLINHIKQL